MKRSNPATKEQNPVTKRQRQDDIAQDSKGIDFSQCLSGDLVMDIVGFLPSKELLGLMLVNKLLYQYGTVMALIANQKNQPLMKNVFNSLKESQDCKDYCYQQTLHVVPSGENVTLLFSGRFNSIEHDDLPINHTCPLKLITSPTRAYKALLLAAKMDSKKKQAKSSIYKTSWAL